MKTLIVEDEAVSCKILETILEDYCDVEIAVDADSAFEKFIEAHENEEPFNLLCLDVNMPNASGIDLLNEVRAFEESNGIVASDGVSVFMVTGDSDPQKIYASTSKGCTAYFTKPIDRVKFLEEFKKLTD